MDFSCRPNRSIKLITFFSWILSCNFVSHKGFLYIKTFDLFFICLSVPTFGKCNTIFFVILCLLWRHNKSTKYGWSAHFTGNNSAIAWQWRDSVVISFLGRCGGVTWPVVTHDRVIISPSSPVVVVMETRWNENNKSIIQGQDDIRWRRITAISYQSKNNQAFELSSTYYVKQLKKHIHN